MPDHEDSLGGETFSGEEQQDPAEQSLGDGHTMGGDTSAHSLGDQSTFGDANVDDELFDDGMKLEDLSERYTEEGVLGKGGMGEVIRATDTRLGRKVAIKRILGKAARSKTAVARFLTEAKSMAELSHPNIVQIYDYGRATGGPFLIMECVQGGSLLDKCKAGPIELDEAVNIFGQLCDGLAKAHAAGIIHRDIKPANVLLTEDGIPKLTDFGLAKDGAADTGMTMEGAVIGTLDFMPPEQRQAAELTDHRSDLWSLAATFYQMLTGEPPRVIDLDLLPPAIRPALAKALKSKKADRFQSAVEMREAILQAHSGKMDTSRSLGEGECPQCATRNLPDRKFCRECSVKLQVSCLKCEQDMAIWDKGCGVCGAQQQPLVKKRFDQLQKKHDAAEKCLQELNFEEAETEASVIAAEEDSRLQNFQIWHEEFSQRLVDTRKTEHERLKELLEEAKTHEENWDYKASARSLNRVNKQLEDHELKNLGSAKSIHARITEILARIKELSTANETVKEQAVSFLECFEFDKAIEAARAIETDDHPHLKEFDAWVGEFGEEVQSKQNAAYKQLKEQLSEALGHEENYDYAAGLKTLQQVAPALKQTSVSGNEDTAEEIAKRLTTKQSRLKELEEIVRERVSKRKTEGLLAIVDELLSLKPDRPEVQKLKSQLEKLKVNNLRDRIASAISGNQLLDVLPVVEQCLVLKPGQDDLVKLKNDLIAREAELDSRNQPIISQVHTHMQQQQFDAALEILGTITPQQQTSSTAALSQTIEEKVLLANAPITNAIGMKFNKIPAGSFLMGSPADEIGRTKDEYQHKVTISKSFYMQTTEVTQGQWKAVMGTEPWKGKTYVKEGPDYAASYVNWDDAVAYCKKLSEKEGKTYRLPTEAEWEYACRAGTKTTWSFGDEEKELGDYAWYDKNAGDIGERYAHQVGLKKPNAFGLYDMHGNVFEWCRDCYGGAYYKSSRKKDPEGPTPNPTRVSRGGSWYRNTRSSRSANRNGLVADFRSDHFGFRLVRELD
jgi:sulfatase modifying factor 1